ncbi:MAG: ROK family glucokinase [Actinomycetota bacterium]
MENLSIGVDIGGTKVLGGVVDASGNILMTHREDTPRIGGSALTQTIIGVIQELLAVHPATSVGISAAGFVSSDRQTMLATPNIAGWNGINLKEEIFREIKLPIVIENDANAAAWGEAVYGAGRGESELMMVTVGTGLGGGLVNNGTLYRGAFGVAAEIGHMRVVPDGHPCGCGALGCLEQYASGSALHRHVLEAIAKDPVGAAQLLARGDGTINGLKGNHITDAAREGDPIAVAAFNTTGDWLGAGIASICIIVDPACVVVGGGVIDAGDLLMKPTRAAIEKYMPFNGKHPAPKVLVAELGNDAGLVGVADLARR